MVGRDEILDWNELLSEVSLSDDVEGFSYDLPVDEQGRVIHSYIEDEFDDLDDVRFEDYVAFDGGDDFGRYDCFDGNFVYEFKTKNDHVLESDYLPFEEDVTQVKDYMDGVGTDLGVVVYLSREDLSVDRYIVLD